MKLNLQDLKELHVCSITTSKKSVNTVTNLRIVPLK